VLLDRGRVLRAKKRLDPSEGGFNLPTDLDGGRQRRHPGAVKVRFRGKLMMFRTGWLSALLESNPDSIGSESSGRARYLGPANGCTTAEVCCCGSAGDCFVPVEAFPGKDSKFAAASLWLLDRMSVDAWRDASTSKGLAG